MKRYLLGLPFAALWALSYYVYGSRSIYIGAAGIVTGFSLMILSTMTSVRETEKALFDKLGQGILRLSILWLAVCLVVEAFRLLSP